MDDVNDLPLFAAAAERGDHDNIMIERKPARRPRPQPRKPGHLDQVYAGGRPVLVTAEELFAKSGEKVARLAASPRDAEASFAMPSEPAKILPIRQTDRDEPVPNGAPMQVVPFPRWRHRPFVLKHAANVAIMEPEAGNNYLANQLRVQHATMAKRGIAAFVIEAEIKALEAAIRTEASRQTQIQEGAAR